MQLYIVLWDLVTARCTVLIFLKVKNYQESIGIDDQPALSKGHILLVEYLAFVEAWAGKKKRKLGWI